MKPNQKKLKKISGILATSTGVLAATTTAFIVEEVRLNNLIKEQERLWINLDNFKKDELKNDPFLTKIVQNILNDNPVLNLFNDTFKKVTIKIENLKFALEKFKAIIDDKKNKLFEKYISLQKEIKDYIDKDLKFDEYNLLKAELQNSSNDAKNSVYSDKSATNIINQIKILEDNLEKIKKAKALQDNDIKAMVFVDFESALKKLNDFINQTLSSHDFYDNLKSNEEINRDEIIKNINPETSSVGDILEAKEKLITELEIAKQKALEISKLELEKIYQKAKKYANEVLVTPDDMVVQQDLIKSSDEKYNLAKNSNDFDVVYDNIENISNYIKAAETQKYINDAIRENALDTFKEVTELANDFIKDFNDNKYPDIKKEISDVLANESKDINLKTFSKIYESANNILDKLNLKKEEAQKAYDNIKTILEQRENELNEPKYQSIKQEIIDLLNEQNKIRNNPEAKTREIWNSVEVLKNFESQINNKKQAKDNVNLKISEVENYIKTHTHEEDKDTIQKLKEALDNVKTNIQNSSDSADVQKQNNDLSIVFEQTKQAVNETAKNRDKTNTEYEKVVDKVNKLLDKLKDHDQLYPDLANKLKTKKTETDAIFAKKDTQSTNDQLTEAKNDLQNILNEVSAQKDQIDLDNLKKQYEDKLKEATDYDNGLDETKYAEIKNKLKNDLDAIKTAYDQNINDTSKPNNQKVEDVKEAIKKIINSLADAKHDKEAQDKNKKYQEYLRLKNLIKHFSNNDLQDTSSNFIKKPLNDEVSKQSQLIENTTQTNQPTLKDDVTIEQIQSSIDALQKAYDDANKLKVAKDNFDSQVDLAKAKLAEIKTPQLNPDDKQLYDTLKNTLDQSQDFFNNESNKTEDNFNQKATELDNAIKEADKQYKINKQKREQAKTNLENKINQIKKYVNDNLKTQDQNNSVIKPEHQATEQKISEELQKAKTINDNALSTENDLINALNSLNDQEQIMHTSETFDHKQKEATDFSNKLIDPLEKTIKNNLDLNIDSQTNNKINAANNLKNPNTLDNTIAQINKAKDDLNNALEEAKKQQLAVFQNTYDNLSNKAGQLLTELDESNVELNNKHPEYPEILNSLKTVKDQEDPKALSTATPTPTIEILKQAIPKLQKAYDDAYLAKSKADFDKVYQDILNKFKDDVDVNKYSQIKAAVIKHLQPQKDIRDKDSATANEINEATKLLKSLIPFFDLTKQKFDDYIETKKQVQTYKNNLESLHNPNYDEIINTLQQKLNDYSENTINEDEKLSQQKYQDYKQKLQEALDDAKIAKAKKDYDVELINKLTDKDFDSKYNNAKSKYNNEVQLVSQNLIESLNNSSNPKQKVKSYEMALQDLQKANASVEKNKAIDDYEQILDEAKTYANSLTNDYQKKVLYDLKNVITNNDNDKNHINKEENYLTVSKQRIKEATKNLKDALKQAQQEEKLIKAQKDNFDQKVSELQDAKQKYPNSATQLEQIHQEKVNELNEKINNIPPTIDANSYKDAADALEQAIKKAAYDKYQDLLNNQVKPYINNDLSSDKYNDIKTKLQDAIDSHITNQSSKDELDNAYDNLEQAFKKSQAKKDFDDTYQDIINVISNDQASDDSLLPKNEVVKNAIITKLTDQKAIRDNETSTTNDIIEAKNKLQENNNKLKTDLEDVVLHFNQYKDKFKEVLEYKNNLAVDQTEAKKILTDALEKYKQANITSDDILTNQKYDEFKNKLSEALDQAKSIEESKNNYTNEKNNPTPDSDFANYPESLKKYKDKGSEITGTNGLLKHALDAATTPEDMKNAYVDATNALKKAKEDIELNKAKEDYDKKVKELETLKNSLSKNNPQEKTIIDELQKAKDDSHNVLSPKENDHSVTKENYNDETNKLNKAIEKAKLDKSKKDYELAKNSANNTSTSDLNGNFPQTKQDYDSKLQDIQSDLNKKLTEAGDDVNKQKQAYDEAKDAIDNLNNNLDTNKTNETNQKQQEYENSLNKLNDALKEAEKIQDDTLKNKIKTKLQEAKDKAQKLLTEPKTPNKYDEAKKVLEDAINSAKTDEFDHLKQQADSFVTNDLNDQKYNDIKQTLNNVKDTENNNVHLNNATATTQNIQESINKLKEALDNAKNQKAKKDFDDKYDSLKNSTSNDKIKKAIEKELKPYKDIRDNPSSTTDAINEATNNLSNSNLNNKINQTNEKQKEYDNELANALDNEQKLNQKFGSDESAKNQYTQKLQEAKDELQKVLDNENSSLDDIKHAYEDAKDKIKELNSGADSVHNDAVTKYKEALKTAKDKKDSITKQEESKIKKDLENKISTNTIQENNIDSTPTNDLKQKTRELQNATEQATQKQQEIQSAKQGYDNKVTEVTDAKTKYPAYTADLQNAIDSAKSIIDGKQTNKTIESSDFDTQKDNLQKALDKVKAKKAFDDAYETLKNNGSTEQIKKAIEKEAKQYKDIKDNSNSTTDAIKKATSDLNGSNISNKVTQTNAKKDEYDKELQKVLDDTKLAQKFGNDVAAKNKYKEEIKKAKDALEAVLNSENPSLDNLKDAYQKAKDKIKELNANVENTHNQAVDEYKKALEAAKTKKESLNDAEESKIKKDLENKISTNTIQENNIDSTPTSELKQKTEALKTAKTNADQKQQEIQNAKQGYDAKVNELKTAKTTYSTYSEELDKALTDASSAITNKQTNKTIESSDFNTQKDNLQKALDKVKAKDHFDKEYNSILSSVGDNSNHSNIKNAVINKLADQKKIKDDANSTTQQINDATTNLHKDTTIQTINAAKEALNNLITKENELTNLKTTTYNSDDEIKNYIDTVTNNPNNLHTSVAQDHALEINSYTSKKPTIQNTINKAKEIKDQKNIYSNSLNSLNDKVSKITGENAAKAKQLLQNQINWITNKIRTDITNAHNDPDKLKKVYTDANASTQTLLNNVDKYKAIADYEAKLAEVTTYKNGLNNKQEYNKIKNDLTKAISQSESTSNKNNEYRNKNANDIKQAIKILDDAKKAAEAEKTKIDAAKQGYDAKVNEYNQYKNKQENNEWKNSLATEQTHQENALNTKIHNNTIVSGDYTLAKEALDNKIKEVAGLKYKKLSEDVKTYITSTLSTSDNYYKDLKNALESTKTTEDNKSLIPTHQPTREQAEASYTTLNSKYTEIKDKYAQRTTLINSFNNAKNNANAAKTQIKTDYADINIDSWIEEEMKKINNKFTSDVNNSLIDNSFTNAITSYQQLIPNAYKEIVKNIQQKIQTALSESQENRIQESRNEYTELEKLKSQLDSMNYSNDSYKELIKNINNKVNNHISTINSNKEKYRTEHEAALAKITEHENSVKQLESELTNWTPVDTNWGKSIGETANNALIRNDKTLRDEAINNIKKQIDELKKQAEQKSIASNTTVKNSTLNPLTQEKLTKYTDSLKAITETFISNADIQNPENGFNGGRGPWDKQTLVGYTLNSQLLNLYNNLKNQFIESYNDKNTKKTDLTIKDYKNYRDKVYNYIKLYEDEMYKLKKLLKTYIDYNEKDEDGKYLQAFRKAYGYLPLIAGYKPWHDKLNDYYKLLKYSTFMFKEFDSFKVNDNNQTQNLHFKDVYETIYQLQSYSTEANKNETDESKGLYQFINKMKSEMGDLKAKSANFNNPQIKYRENYYWQKQNNHDQDKVTSISFKNKNYSFYDYIEFMIKSLKAKRASSNHPIFILKQDSYYKEVDHLSSSRQEFNNTSTPNDEYKKHQTKIEEWIADYFKEIDSNFDDNAQKHIYKQLLLWDGKDNTAENIKVNETLNYYSNENNSGLTK
ncbi:hypothetical protein [Mycoplasma miroungirhinis]|uniref:Importin N-terminal domain-containing protein n=1 Tax=Mycoplasma miroungirhinis TaxID=754516 RepID=A0A6M4JDF4_9MOLU|nr:hypothetical protein [Mycoplasma miroungirhinis]QJR44099.1 hypothetical protein HLA92_01455 [Mycoplasma miroungirhinis]